MAPARCATLVSTVITRSRFSMSAAVSPKSLSASSCAATSCFPNQARSVSPISRARVHQKNEGPKSASNVAGAMDRRRSFAFIFDPCQTTPTRGLSLAPNLAAQWETRSWSARTYGGSAAGASVSPRTQGALMRGSTTSHACSVSPVANTVTLSSICAKSVRRGA